MGAVLGNRGGLIQEGRGCHSGFVVEAGRQAILTGVSCFSQKGTCREGCCRQEGTWEGDNPVRGP